jgi:hypothetical protein
MANEQQVRPVQSQQAHLCIPSPQYTGRLTIRTSNSKWKHPLAHNGNSEGTLEKHLSPSNLLGTP